jgi:hypothetical protein
MCAARRHRGTARPAVRTAGLRRPPSCSCPRALPPSPGRIQRPGIDVRAEAAQRTGGEPSLERRGHPRMRARHDRRHGVGTPTQMFRRSGNRGRPVHTGRPGQVSWDVTSPRRRR